MISILFTPIQQFTLGPLTIHVWGLMVAIGIIVGLFVAKYLAKKEKIHFDHILNITLIAIIFGFIGSRLLYVFLEYQDFKDPLDIFRLWDGGLAMYGGLVLAIIISLIYAKKAKLPVLKTADIITPALVIAFAISRIGCFLINDHLGKITDILWGIKVIGVARHPISAYYILSLLILFVVLMIYRKKLLQSAGLTTYFALIWYSFFRFIIDFFRDFEGRSGAFLTNQIFLGLVFIISAYYLFKTLKK